MSNTAQPLSNPTTNSSPRLFHSNILPSPLAHLPSPTLCKSSLPKFRTPAFFPVTRFHKRKHFSPFPTLTMSFILGWIAKSFTPVGVPPKGAVSPLGRPWAFGIGAFIVESTVQSRVRATAIVLSSAPDKSFERVGKCKAFMAALWCRRDPSSRFLGFSLMLLPANVGIERRLDFCGGVVDRW